MSIIKFLAANWDSVIVVAVVAAVLIILYRRGRLEIVKKILFALVTQAEKEFGAGTGDLKKAAVIQWLYERLPKIITLLVTPKEIENLIESVLEYAKTKWETNPLLQNYIAEQDTGEKTE